MRMHYDHAQGCFVPSNGSTVIERERGLRMAGHDALPPEWRDLSRMIQGRAVENHFKRKTPIAKVRKAVIGIHHGNQE